MYALSLILVIEVFASHDTEANGAQRGHQDSSACSLYDGS